MTTKEEILGQFELFNIKPSEQVLSKCLEMCLKYNIVGEDMVDQWFAYTSSKLRGAAPTVEYLEQMERKEFMKKKEQDTKNSYTEEQISQSPVSSRSNRAQNSENVQSVRTPKGNDAPKSKIQTPLQSRKFLDESLDTIITSPGISLGTYSRRTNAKSMQCVYGPKDAKFKRTFDLDVSIKPYYEDNLKPNQQTMYETLRKRVRCIDNMTEDLVTAIAEKYHLIDHLKLETQDESQKFIYGKIISDSDGKINSQSILLEQTQTFKGICVALNLSNLSTYSLFSGQSVIAKGSRLIGHNDEFKMVVEELYTDTNFSFLPEPPLPNASLQVIIASGPFTVQDNLSFEPLNDLLQYVKEHNPHVLILTGPFYDKTHQTIENGDLRQSFDSFFFDLIDTVMGEIQKTTHVIIVSSQKEPHHFPVYPTPPYEMKQKYPNLLCMPDPCMVNINGLIIGTTTADILFDIGSFEVNLDKTKVRPADRMSRLASYVLKQQSFYPLNPPGKNMYVDFSLMEHHGVMGVKPHILVLPSNLRMFIKEVDNCLVINPEKLTKGNGGGTFAKIEVFPGCNPTVCGRTAVEIISI